MSARDDRAREYFTRNNARLRKIERRLILAFLIVWALAIVADSVITLEYVREPLQEGNEALSALMTHVGVPNAICIGLVFHVLLCGFWAGVCWAVHRLSVWRFKTTIPVARIVPLCMFILRDTGEHVYGFISWL